MQQHEETKIISEVPALMKGRKMALSNNNNLMTIRTETNLKGNMNN